MKTISTAAIVALMTASIALGAMAPAIAQETTATTQAQPVGAERGFRHGPGMRHGGMGLFDIGRGAEAIEIAIVRLTHTIELTDQQTVLLEALKTDALAAAAAFETATDGLRPTPPAEEETAALPDISRRFDNRIALESARLDALKSVQPAFTAFFDSLTDEQKAELASGRGDRMARMGKQHGGQRPMAPGNR